MNLETLPGWFRIPEWHEWIVPAAVMAAGAAWLLVILVARIRERRAEEARIKRLIEIAETPLPPGRIPPPASFTYTRVQWLADVYSGVPIEEIFERVVRSGGVNGTWRFPPPPPRSDPPAPTSGLDESGVAGGGLGSLLWLAGLCTGPLLAASIRDRRTS